MDKKAGKETKILWILKALLLSYVVTGALLLLLALLLYRLQLDEQAVSAGIVAIYIAATLIGGLAAGKMAKSRRFLWGLMTESCILCSSSSSPWGCTGPWTAAASTWPPPLRCAREAA